MPPLKLLSLASAALLAFTPALSAQTIHGTITEAVTGRAIPAAAVVLLDSGAAVVAQATSDGQGNYALRAEGPGSYRVRFTVPGYQATESGQVELAPGGTLQVDAALSPLAALALDTVLVEGEQVPRYLAGFYQRSQFGWGSFFTASSIAGSESKKFTDLTARFRGFVVRYDQMGHRTISNNKRERHQGICAPLVYLDGALVGDAASYDVDTIKVDWIAAIEAYNSPAFTPLEFNTADAVCGVIVVWLKRGSELRR